MIVKLDVKVDVGEIILKDRVWNLLFYFKGKVVEKIVKSTLLMEFMLERRVIL